MARVRLLLDVLLVVLSQLLHRTTLGVHAVSLLPPPTRNNLYLAVWNGHELLEHRQFLVLLVGVTSERCWSTLGVLSFHWFEAACHWCATVCWVVHLVGRFAFKRTFTWFVFLSLDLLWPVWRPLTILVLQTPTNQLQQGTVR